MFGYVLHLSLGRHQDSIRSHAKSAELYLELPLLWLLRSYPIGAGDTQSFHHMVISHRNGNSRHNSADLARD
jgi:hypothetical protein